MKRKTHFVVSGAVAGVGPFPLVMLTTDEAVPRTSEDAAAVSMTGYRMVRLDVFTRDGRGLSSPAWRAHGWVTLSPADVEIVETFPASVRPQVVEAKCRAALAVAPLGPPESPPVELCPSCHRGVHERPDLDRCLRPLVHR